jgi:predicted ATPase
MVGRGHERAELAAALAEARGGRGRVVLLLGEAGMGKSMLADWVVGCAAADGLRTVRAWCSAAGMPPLRVWERALSSMGLTLPWQQRGVGAARPDRELVAAAVVESLAGVSRSAPLLVVLEDVHWCDPASLLVARAVADAAAALPLTLLMTCRDDRQEMAPQVRDQLAELPTAVRRVSLPPLGVAEVADLAAISLGQELPEDEVRELHARAGGNPFLRS